MAGTDSAGVNERLNGLVTLLQSVGIDGVDSDALLDQQKRKSKPKKKTSSTYDNNTSSEAQILEIVKKLQQAQADSPEILEALKSPELLALASLAAQKQGLQSAPPEPKPAAPSLDDVMDDDDDNYPKIGPGYSDDISVVSELSTPTVMTRQSVNEEEYYSEVKAGGSGAAPPFAAGRSIGLRQPTRNKVAGKNKNMVGQVRPLAARRAIPAIPPKPSGGAAAQRRLNYQMAMSKLESDGFGSPTPEPVSPEDKKPARSASGARSIGSGSGGGSKRKPRSINSKIKSNDEIDWGMADEDGWPTFEDANNSGNELFVDSDGFFSSENVFASNDKTTKSRRKKATDASTSSGGKKKSSREERGGSTRKSHRLKKEREAERAYSDDDREGSTRKSHRLKKDKDKDTLSDDGTGTARKSKSKKDKDKDKEKDKDKSGRRKARRATMV